MPARIPEHLQKPHETHAHWLMRRIWERLNHNNEHFMGVVVGREGSGKSYTAIKIAHLLDPDFSAERIIFDVTSLLEDLRDGNHEPGQWYVLDEAGVQLGRRTWQERGQVLANQALQLIRDHNLGLLFTLPRLSELDSQTQGRLHAFFELMEKEDGEYVTGKWKWMDPDRADDTGKIYKKYPRRIVGGVNKRITRFAFSPPPVALLEKYEPRKSEFQRETYEKTIKELSDAEDEAEEENKSLQEMAKEIADNGVEKVIGEDGRTGEPMVSRPLIRAHFDVSDRDARSLKKLLEKEIDVEAMAV